MRNSDHVSAGGAYLYGENSGQSRIHARGEVAQQIRERDWAGTPLGPISDWSETLVAVVNLMLSYPFSYSLYWGSQRTMLYNDVYAQFLYDKHPNALGLPAEQVWREAWEQVGPEIKGAFEGSETIRSETLIPIHVNGQFEDRWFTYGLYPVYEKGQIVGVVNPGTDVTASVLARRAEEELRIGRERIRLALESASIAFWFYDPARNIVGGDQRMRSIFGVDVPEGPAERWLSAIIPEDRERVGQEFAAAVNGAPYDTEYRVNPHGEICWVRAKASLLSEEDAGSVRMLGICENITERKRAEAKLTATVERLAFAEQIGNIAAWEWDLDSGAFVWDSACTWVYGRPPEELDHIDKIMPLIHSEDVSGIEMEVSTAIRTVGELNTEFRAIWPDGTVHWLLGKGRPVADEHGVVRRMNGVNIDVTDRRNAEIALLQNEKLAAVGKLASTISHEINNPLEAVTNLLFIVRQDPSISQSSKDFLEVADRELARISQVASQTLRFHRQATDATSVRPDSLIEEVLQLYSTRLANSNIKVRRDYAANLLVTCYEGTSGRF